MGSLLPLDARMPVCDYGGMPDTPAFPYDIAVRRGTWSEVPDEYGAVRVTQDGRNAALVTLTAVNGEGGVRLTPHNLRLLADILLSAAENLEPAKASPPVAPIADFQQLRQALEVLVDDVAVLAEDCPETLVCPRCGGDFDEEMYANCVHVRRSVESARLVLAATAPKVEEGAP